MVTVPRCDGIPLPNLQFHNYKKVVPTADGLRNNYDPIVFFERLIELKLIPYSTISTILPIMVEYDIVINYPPEPLFDFYLVESYDIVINYPPEPLFDFYLVESTISPS